MYLIIAIYNIIQHYEYYADKDGAQGNLES